MKFLFEETMVTSATFYVQKFGAIRTISNAHTNTITVKLHPLYTATPV